MRGALLVLVGVSVAAGAAACGGSAKTDYMVVTVDARPAVHDAASLSVTLANAGTMRSDTFMLDGTPFPVTFSISAPGRAGDLALTVDASDANGLVIGHGNAMTTVHAPSASVLLDSTDFVVNTDYADDQFPTDDYQSVGFQLAAQPDGTWTVAFRDGCMQGACNVFARRFSATGKPVSIQAAAGTSAFVVTARPSDQFTEPAVASSQTATVALWNFDDLAPATTTGIACRTLNAAGALGANQTSISSDLSPATVSVAALSTGDFVASWNAFPATGIDLVVRSALVKPDCSAPGGVRSVSTAGSADRNAVASSADHVLFTWVVSGDLRARVAPSTGVPSTPEAVLVKQTATDRVMHARAAPLPDGGFALAVRWAAKASSAAPGKIELYQVTAAGALVGTPVGTPALVTDQSGSSFFDDEGFGFASRPDGTMLVAWHVCSPSGDLCTLSGRILKRADPGAGAWASPVTDAFAIPTTTGNSQKRPSVVGLPDAFAVVWSDSSGKPPDTSGQAVRARIIYPPAPPGG
jgi:hypothetical protein